MDDSSLKGVLSIYYFVHFIFKISFMRSSPVNSCFWPPQVVGQDELSVSGDRESLANNTDR